MSRRAQRLTALTALAGLLVSGVAAQETRFEARLLPGWAEANGVRVAGLDIRLAPGWKTYWRAPGAAGLPPQFDFAASTNVADVRVEWPSPRAFDSFGMTTIGYADHVTLPLVISPEDPSLPVALRVSLDFGVCADICVPERLDMTIEIAPGAATDGAAKIVAAQAAAPVPAERAGLVQSECGLRGAGQSRAFHAALEFSPAAPQPVAAVVEGPEGVWIEMAETQTDGRTLRLTAPAFLRNAGAWVAREDLRVTLIGGDGDGAIELAGCHRPAEARRN